MASELPPPSYEDVVSAFPVRPRSMISRQDSLPPTSQLIQEVTRLRQKTLGHLAGLRKMTTDIDASYSRLKTQRTRVEHELSDWRAQLLRLINEAYEEKLTTVTDGFDTLEHKMVINREKVLQTFESARQLCWSVHDLGSYRCHHSVMHIKRRFADKLEEIEALHSDDERLPERAMSSWKFVKPEVEPADVSRLVGEIEQSFPAPTVAAATAAAGATAASSSGRTLEVSRPDLAGGEDIPDGESREPDVSGLGEAAAAAAAVAGRDSRSSTIDETQRTQQQEQEQQEEAEAYDNYTLLYSIQTKTFKDKARCHPFSIAVDFDGNVIVPDKFNQKIKIFTQRGQLIREITHPALMAPTHVTLTLAGDLAVSDFESADIKFFSTGGDLLGNVPNLPSPGGLTFNLRGDLLVTDTGRKAVHIVDPQVGVIKSSIQYYMAEPEPPARAYYDDRGQPIKQRYNYFLWPHYVTTGHNDEIVVTDRAAGNFQVFDVDRNFLSVVGQSGGAVGEFNDPYGVSSFADTGKLLVADYGNHRVQMVTVDGNFRDEPILSRERHGLHFPTYVTHTSDEKLLVCEYLSGLIKIFSGHSEHIEDPEALPPAYTDVVAPDATNWTEPSAPPDLPVTGGSFTNFPRHYGPDVGPPSPPPLLTSQQSFETTI